MPQLRYKVPVLIEYGMVLLIGLKMIGVFTNAPVDEARSDHISKTFSHFGDNTAGSPHLAPYLLCKRNNPSPGKSTTLGGVGLET